MPEQIIGYGSLLNEASLHRTCPHSRIVQPVWIDGWRRHCETAAIRGLGNHGSYTVMDVEPRPDDSKSGFNAVLLEINDDDMPALRQREGQYQQVTVHAREAPGAPATIETSMWYGAEAQRSQPNWDHPMQHTYLLTCMLGGQTIDTDFLDTFCATTWLDGVTLRNHPHFAGLMQSLQDTTDTAYGMQRPQTKDHGVTEG